eukprot:Pgem_evm1s19164
MDHKDGDVGPLSMVNSGLAIDMMKDSTDSASQNNYMVDLVVDLDKDMNEVKKPKIQANTYPARMWELKFGEREIFHFKINPVAFLFSMAMLLGIIIFVVLKGEDSYKELNNFIFMGTTYEQALGNRLAWFFLGSIASWLLFSFYLIFVYGHIKLGEEDEEPEFDNLSYFSMIFTAGAAMGIYFYGVNEGISNSMSGEAPSATTKTPYSTQNQKDMWAMVNCMFDWGVNCFVPYALVGILVAYQCFVKKLPMCMRSLYYEFLGDYVWGYLGDFIDGYCIVSVMSGLLPSLSISVNSLLDGMSSLGWIDPACSASSNTNCSSKEFRDNLSMIIVATIILLATISVASGLNRGIKILATIATIGSTTLWLMCFLLEDQSYVLNIIVSTLGQYTTNLVSLSLFTDPFTALKHGQGASLETQNESESWFVAYFPIYYFTWSVAWSPFVGCFYARVSKGRTIREMISYTLLVSFLYYLLWFSLFSGGGIRMQRRAYELIEMGISQGNYALYQDATRPNCYHPPTTDMAFTPSNLFTNADTTKEVTYRYINDNIGPVCWKGGMYNNTNDAVQLNTAAVQPATIWFDYVFQFKEVGVFFAYLSFFCMIIFFVTTSDSTSLVFDTLSSNNDESHSVLQRIFWSIYQGVTTIILIAVGSNGAMKMAQSICILASIPNMIMISIACSNMIYTLKRTERENDLSLEKDPRESRKISGYVRFAIPIYGGVFDIFETIFSLGTHDPRRGSSAPPSKRVWFYTFLSLVAPWYTVFKIYTHNDSVKRYSKFVWAAVCFVLFYGGIGLCIWNPAVGFGVIFWFLMIVMSLRNQCRVKHDIDGNAIEDLFGSLIWFQVLTQILIEEERFEGIKQK